MTGATTFSGIGAPEVAMPWINWKWCAEVEKFPSALLAQRHTASVNLGDVTAADFADRARAFGPIDLLVAGSPCQAFSIAGLRRSLDDERGNLTLRLVELVHAIQPRFLLWENVPGVLSTKDNAFGCLLAGLVGADTALVPASGQRWSNAGVVAGPIRTAAWRVLDAQYFGVPQRRRRVFLVAGCTGARPHPGAILFEPESVRRNSAPSRAEGKDFTFDLAPSIGASGRGFDRPGESRGQDPVIAHAVNAKGGSGRIDGESETFIVGTLGANGKAAGSATQQDAESGMIITHSLRAEGHDASEDGDGPRIPLVVFDTTQVTSRVNRSNPQPGDPCHTLAKGTQAPTVASITDGVRRLMPVEAERLQGFPDDYTAIDGYNARHTGEYGGNHGVADGPRYRALGNSMAVPVIAWIGERIRIAIAANGQIV